MKNKQFEKFINSLSKCDKCTDFNCKQKSLINIYKDYKFSINIPSIWTDWFNRLDSKIMIIGQDWGPFQDMKNLNRKLVNDKSNWKELIESEKSNTKKLLDYYLKESSNGRHNINDAFITNAIMCARQGENYRGNNIDLKKSTLNCSEYLLEQIKIVNPQLILPLGYYPLLSLSNIFHFNIEKTLKETINANSEIKIDDFIIIPLYHPVAQIKKDEQLKQYKKIWKYID